MTEAARPGGTLIRTKLHAPVARELVSRPAPLALLGARTPRPLTLIRAPAGWGKSSLLASWFSAESERRSFAWLALDSGDNDPNRFFGYVIEALRSITASIGSRSTALLATPGVDIVDEVLPVLLNELDDLPDASVLVIEDYHLISSAEIHEAVSFLLDHAPTGFELVLSTRTEPPLNVARHRARGELLEIAVGELAFSVTEATTLLNEQRGLALESADVSRLVDRTEGWPAGLYLAALSLRGRADAPAFVATFAGDDRNVVDYLTSEVLNGQSSEIYDFLLSTSVLGRLCPALCDEVTRSGRSAELLREMEDSNSFVIALDDKRQWYRYHHLFRDLLRHELLIADPDRAVQAHRRAAAWLRGHGETSEAIMHLIAAGDLAEAVELVAASWRPLSYQGNHHTIQTWLEALPPEVHRGDARLCVASAVTAIGSGRLDEVAPWVELAAHAPAAGPFHDGFPSAAAAAGCLRSVNNWLTGDLGACREAGLLAIDLDGEPSLWDPFTHTWLGAATFWLGDSEEGLQRLEEALERCLSAKAPVLEGDSADRGDVVPGQRTGGATAVACLGMLALANLALGDVVTAQARADSALELAMDSGLQEYWVTSAAHTAQADLLTRSGRTDAARVELDRALVVARRGSGPVELITALVARALAAEGDGDRDEARTFVAEARSTLLSCADPGPVVSSLVRKAEDRLSVARRQPHEAFLLVEEFSDRERDVLRLLGSQLSQREIGDALFISFNTVKSHSKSIYRKLGVGTRSDAVDRARRLELL